VLDGAEAISLIESGSQFDVIVSDIMMPRVNGSELGYELASRGSRVPVLFVSGNYDHPPESLTNLPFRTRFLGKPFALNSLLSLVGELIAEARKDEEQSRLPRQNEAG
ncbi:MAG TPA: response regulator, partial [Polyangiaceae bacterium]|nr:response regulator [Polyangiaceae bacterium]